MFHHWLKYKRFDFELSIPQYQYQQFCTEGKYLFQGHGIFLSNEKSQNYYWNNLKTLNPFHILKLRARR